MALALALAPVSLGVAAAMPMPEKMAAKDGAGAHCGCAKTDTGCAQSEACFVQCATAPALETKHLYSRFLDVTAVTVEELDPSQLDSLLTPPPHPPPRA